MKHFWLRIFCCLSALTILAGMGTPMQAAPSATNDLYSVYAHLVNDYLLTYGAVSTANPGEQLDCADGSAPNGVIYGELMDFDQNQIPYLVLFLTESKFQIASCHVWQYDPSVQKAFRVAVLDKSITPGQGETGEFNVGRGAKGAFFSYRTYQGETPIGCDYYTLKDGKPMLYLTDPDILFETGIMDFSENRFHPGIDVSRRNRQFSLFFDYLKDQVSIQETQYTNLLPRMKTEDVQALQQALETQVHFPSFDIDAYATSLDYEQALAEGSSISLENPRAETVYDLGEECYYVIFSTQAFSRNDALLKRTQSGFSLLRSSIDCIPTGALELEQLQHRYKDHPFLEEAAQHPLRLSPDPTGTHTADRKVFGEIKETGNLPAPMKPVLLGTGALCTLLLLVMLFYLYKD